MSTAKLLDKSSDKANEVFFNLLAAEQHGVPASKADDLAAAQAAAAALCEALDVLRRG